MGDKGRSNTPDDRDGGEEYVSLPLLKVGEAARYLGVGRKILYQLLERGEIRAVKDRGTLLVEKESLDRFISSGRLT